MKTSSLFDPLSQKRVEKNSYPMLGTFNRLSLIFTIVKQYLYYNKVAITSVFSVRKLKYKAVVTLLLSHSVTQIYNDGYAMGCPD